MGDFCHTLRGIDTLLMSSELKKGEVGGESLMVVLGCMGENCELSGDDIAGVILLFRCCRRMEGSSRRAIVCSSE